MVTKPSIFVLWTDKKPDVPLGVFGFLLLSSVVRYFTASSPFRFC